MKPWVYPDKLLYPSNKECQKSSTFCNMEININIEMFSALKDVIPSKLRVESSYGSFIVLAYYKICLLLLNICINL